MKQKRLELRLTSLELKRLQFLASEVLREYGFKVSLQQLTRALMQLALGDEPEEGFETPKGKFGLVGIISNFKGVGQNSWEEEKKIKEALEANLANRDFDRFVAEYEALINKIKKGNKKGKLNKKEKSRLEVLRERLDKEIAKSQAEEAKIRQWRKEGRYRSRRRRKE